MHLDRRSVWSTFLPELRHAVRAHLSLAYGVRLTDEGPEVAFVEGAPTEAVSRERVAQFTEGFSRSRDYTAFNPLRVEPPQRNRVMQLAELRGGGASAHWQKLGVGGHDQLRVLACEEQTLLAWVGAYREEPFTPRERLILQAVTPALRERLLLEQRMENGPLARAALDASLEALVRPAVIIDGRGHVHFANSLARAALETDASALRERLLASLRGESLAYAISPLSVAGAVAYALAIEAAAPRDPALLVREAQQRWGLTPRETQTLGLLAEGLSNRAISGQLACAERTVEVHVANVLSKSNCDSRAQLIARLWNMLGAR
jgi:DNA-binding CsgD family transcriptional regulator